MSLTTTILDGNTTVVLTRTGPSALIANTLTDASHVIWEDTTDDKGNVTTFAQATDAQRLAQLETAIVNYVLQLARDYNSGISMTASAVTTKTQNIANYSL